MFATPQELLDTSIAQLQMLTAFLGDQLADSAVKSKSSDTPEMLACREILVSLGALIVKVRAASRLTSGRKCKRAYAKRGVCERWASRVR